MLKIYLEQYSQTLKLHKNKVLQEGLHISSICYKSGKEIVNALPQRYNWCFAKIAIFCECQWFNLLKMIVTWMCQLLAAVSLDWHKYVIVHGSYWLPYDVIPIWNVLLFFPLWVVAVLRLWLFMSSKGWGEICIETAVWCRISYKEFITEKLTVTRILCIVYINFWN